MSDPIPSPVHTNDSAIQMASKLTVKIQKFPRNENAVRGLVPRSEEMAKDFKVTDDEEILSQPTQSAIDGLNDLLTKVATQLKVLEDNEWARQPVNQEHIAGKINDLHKEIDLYSQKYVMELADKVFKQEIFEDQKKADHEGLFKVLQQRMLASRENSEERTGLEANFSALICSLNGLPPVYEVTPGLIVKTVKVPSYEHSKFDIYRGVCYGKFEAAIKVLRHVKINDCTKQRFSYQYKHWKAIYEKDRGEHILPLLSAVYEAGPEPMLCSQWMKNGNAIDYVKRAGLVDRRELVRNIADGLAFMHHFNPPLMHGYVRGSKILINDSGEPLLSGFNYMRAIGESLTLDIPQIPEAARWLPFEVFYNDELKLPSLKVDISMWAMTALELMTEDVPFNHIRNPYKVMSERRDGLKPARPGPEVTARGLDDKLWALMERCWADEPEERPSIKEVLGELEDPQPKAVEPAPISPASL